MDFIGTNGKLDLGKLDETAYAGWNGLFTEDVDKHLAEMLCETTLVAPEAIAEFKKLARNIKPNGTIQVRYYTPKNVGRRFASEKNTLTIQARAIKNTMFHFNSYIDYDFVASHPTLETQISKKFRRATPRLDEWVANKDPIIASLSAHHSVEGELALDKDNIKKLINATLYGGGIDRWKRDTEFGDPVKNILPKCVQNTRKGKEHTWWAEFKKECDAFKEWVWANNSELAERVCDPADELWGRKNTLVSYYLGAFENDCLYHAYCYLVDNGLIKKRHCALAYDGLTAPHPPPHTDLSFHLGACNDYIFEKTGFQVRLVVKKFEEDTILRDVIDNRRNLVTAAAEAIGELEVVPIEGEQGEAIVEDDCNDNEYLIWRDKFERNHAKIINTSSFIKIVWEDEEEEILSGIVTFNKSQLLTSYEHEKYTITRNGKKKTKRYIQEWINDSHIRKFESCDIVPPPKTCPPRIFNLWKPSFYSHRKITDADAEWDPTAIAMFENHLKIICGHEPDAYDYFLNWLSHLIQKPAEKSTHICITSKQGTGKNFLFEIVKKIIGGLTLESSTPERDVWGGFNGAMMGALLVILSETDKRNLFGAEGKFKALITDPKLMINQKNKDTFEINSYHRFVTLTNNPDPIPMEEGDRRTMVIKSSTEKKGDFKYFEDFDNYFKKDAALRTLFWWLNTRDITTWQHRRIPQTSYHQELKEHARSYLDVFFENWVGDQLANGLTGKVSKFGVDLYECFKHYKEKHGGSYDLKSEGDLVKKLLLNLDLPKGAMEKGGRSGKKGQSRLYDLDLLKIHYKLNSLTPDDWYSGASNLLAGGASAEVESETETTYEAEAIDEEDESLPEPKADENVQLITIGGKQIALKKRLVLA
jgi:hypothetical protein